MLLNKYMLLLLTNSNAEESMFKAEDIAFSYKKKKVLTKIDLSVNKGDCIGILGKNGCGKSTFLSILAGCLKPDNGKIFLNGLELTHGSKNYGIIGYVPQENPLIPELSVMDNLLFWFKDNKQELLKKLNTPLFCALAIEDILKQKVSKLSGGQKKRVSIASTLLNGPKLLILDEPSSSLDIICRDIIKNFMQAYLKDGGTIIMTTHEEAELALLNKLYIINNGLIYETDKNIRGTELIRKLKEDNNE